MERNKTFFIGSNYNATIPVPKFSKYPDNIYYMYEENSERQKKIRNTAAQVVVALKSVKNDYSAREIVEKILKEEM